MDENNNFLPPPMVEIAVADVRRAGESGLALLDRLARIDRLLAADPGARVVLLVRSSCLPPSAGSASSATAARAAATRGAGSTASAASAAMADDGALLVDLVESAAAGRSRQPSLERVLWEHAQRTLARHRGNRKAAAKALHISDSTLRRRLECRPPA
jgi:ActR/RegA family two-component response regulator